MTFIMKPAIAALTPSKALFVALAMLGMTGMGALVSPPSTTTPNSANGNQQPADKNDAVKVTVTDQSSYGNLTPPNAPGFDSLTAGKALEGDWWLGTQVGELNINVHDGIRIVKLNNQTLGPDRAVWQSQDMVQIYDSRHNKYFAVSLAPGNKINFVRPGSWLQYTPDNVPRVAIGIYTDPLSPGMAAQLGLEPGQALMVTGLVENLPAEKAGVQQFDVIVALDGKRPVTTNLLKQVVLSKDPGDKVSVDLIRRGKPLSLSIAVETIDPSTLIKNTAANDSIDLDKLFQQSPSSLFSFDDNRPIIQFDQGDSRNSDSHGVLLQFPPSDQGSAAHSHGAAPQSLGMTPGNVESINIHIGMLESRLIRMEQLMQRQQQTLDQQSRLIDQLIQIQVHAAQTGANQSGHGVQNNNSDHH